ncbi:MAG TPA: DUF4399 domain-containing protein [Steroidobacteraceae bacterium]|nr:DUF4399 domain-containing protein [Steroidobacteraceae bacterium]
MIRQATIALVALTFGTLAVAQTPAPAAGTALPRTASPAGAKVYIVSPKDGATIKGPVTVVFGLAGMGVAPAGVQMENTGHHHLLIDADLPKDMGVPLPATDNIKHFGKGQTETTLDLKPGKHTLQLVLGDHLHIPFNPVVASQKITITVAP